MLPPSIISRRTMLILFAQNMLFDKTEQIIIVLFCNKMCSRSTMGAPNRTN